MVPLVQRAGLVDALVALQPDQPGAGALGDGTGQLAFAITREMFDFVEASWQAPDAAEMAALNGVRIGI